MIEYKYEICITPPGICLSHFWGIFILKIQDGFEKDKAYLVKDHTQVLYKIKRIERGIFMSKKIKVKPGKSQSMVGFFIGIIFCAIGLFVVIPTFGAFGVLWSVMALIITVTNGINAFSDKGIATHSIEIEDTDKFSQEKESMESRLEKLKGLYEKNLITEEEYEKKKKELLQEL